MALIALLALSFVACKKNKGSNTNNSSEISSSAEEIGSSIEESRSSLEESNSAVEESSSAVEESNSAVEESSSAVEESSSAVEESSSSVEDSSDDRPATYMFTKVINAADRENGRVETSVASGERLDLTAPEGVEGKTFLGWVDGNGNAITVTTMPAENFTIYANWSIDTYTVTVHQDGEEDVVYTFGVEASEELEIIDIKSIRQVIEEEYSPADYIVTGVPETWVLQDCEITVRLRKSYTFTKVLNAADRENGRVKEGIELDLTVPTAEGRTFLGWVDAEGNPITAAVMPAENFIIYANWSIDTYTVTVKQDGKEDVIYTFGVEGVPATETTVEIIAIGRIQQIIESNYVSTDEVEYILTGMPTTWALQNYEITVEAKAVPPSWKYSVRQTA